MFDPATAKPFAQVADGDSRDVELAVAAAQRAFPGWAALPNSVRARWLDWFPTGGSRSMFPPADLLGSEPAFLRRANGGQNVLA